MKVVCNATPLIFLAKLSDIQLLNELYHKVFITKEVYDEIVTKGKGKIGAKELKGVQGDWVEVKTVSNRIKIKELKDIHGLGEGEASAMILSQEIKANLFLTDDGLARKVASNLLQGTVTTVSGTIGVLKFAKEKGLISKDQLKSKIASLIKEGYYLKDALYRQILHDIEVE